MHETFHTFRYWIFGAIVALAIALLFFNLGGRPLLDYDEATYANNIDSTLASGQILTIQYNGYPFYDKPPLLMWSSMAFREVFGRSPFAYRLTAALCGLASIILVMLIAWELSGSAPLAALAGTILLTTGPFVDAARQLRPDVPVIAGILAAVYCFLRGKRAPAWYLGIGISLGIGFLFKDVVTVFGVFFIVLYSLVYRNFRWLRNLYFWYGIVLGAVITAPWYVYEILTQGSAFLQANLGYDILARATSNILSASTWTAANLLGYLARYSFPWSVLCIFAATLSIFFFIKKRSRADARPALICLATALVVIVLFCLVPTKLPYYLLPAYPFFALGLALSLPVVRVLFSRMSMCTLFIAVAVFLLLAAGNTLYFWLHLGPIEKASDTIALDEEHAGQIIADTPDVPVYTYQYNLWDTIRFYSDDRSIVKLQVGDGLPSPAFLIISSKFLEEAHATFPPALAAHLELAYQGPALTLFYFSL